MNGTLWTEDKTKRLRELLPAGMSASRIAAELGTTRNAVLGKAHRLGLKLGGSEFRGPDNRPQAEHPTKPTEQPTRPSTTIPIEVAAEEEAPSGGQESSSNLERAARLLPRPGTCKWPIGHVGDPDFHYCGEAPVPGAAQPYCEHHLGQSRGSSRGGGWKSWVW